MLQAYFVDPDLEPSYLASEKLTLDFITALLAWEIQATCNKATRIICFSTPTLVQPAGQDSSSALSHLLHLPLFSLG